MMHSRVRHRWKGGTEIGRRTLVLELAITSGLVFELLPHLVQQLVQTGTRSSRNHPTMRVVHCECRCSRRVRQVPENLVTAGWLRSPSARDRQTGR